MPALSPKQIVSIVESKQRRISLWSGAVRSGKTIASLIAFVMAVREAPPSGLIVIAGRTLQTIERNLIEPMQDPALFGALAGAVRHTRGSSIVTILGRTVHLIGASDARAEGKLRGLTACLALVDEATLVPNAFFTQLLARLSVPGARLLCTTNPDNPGHWLRKDFILRAGELGMGHWHFSLDDNPSLSAQYVAAIKAEFTGLWYKRMVEGLWVAAEGAVFDMFDEERHVIPRARVPLIDRWISAGVDYGTSNPFAALLVGLGVDNKLYVTDEYRYDSKQVHRQKTDAQYAEALRGWLADIEIPHAQVRTPAGLPVPRRGVDPEFVCVDPSAASFIVQLHDEGHLQPTQAYNSVVDGIRTVSSLFALNRLFIVDTCKGLIGELPGYAWDDDKAKKGIDAPIKANDHSIDGLRYGLATTEGSWRPYVLYDLAA